MHERMPCRKNEGIRGIIMEQKKLDRINELARKSKAEGLSAEEKIEQAQLRSEYIAAYRASLVAALENTYIVDEKGNKTKVQKKKREIH